MANSVYSRLKVKNTTSNDAAYDTASSDRSLTPVKMLMNTERDYSPVFVPCTQETLDDVDVLWDWNSPHCKSRPNRRPKRIINSQKSSPTLPVKKLNCNVSNTFDKIRDELKALQEEIAIPESPTFEFAHAELPLNNNKPSELNDLFDDSLEDDLIMVSQQVEEKFKKETESKAITNVNTNRMATPNAQKLTTASPRTLTRSFSSNTLLDSPGRTTNRSNFDFNGKLLQLKANDSFDAALWNVDENALVFPNNNTRIKREINQEMYDGAAGSANVNIANLNVNVKQEFEEAALKFKTKSLSFGDSYHKKSNEEILKEEIEKKRQAALAKLRARKSLPPVLSDSDTSPIKCSPEEIELKRQQARAKLEQKKNQEMIERNRREALKRLEQNRRKRGQL